MSDPSPVTDPGWFKWGFGALAGAGVLVVKWFNGRIESKVSQDVFEEYKKRNDLMHKITHRAQKRQTQKLDMIFKKLDGKEDKGV